MRIYWKLIILILCIQGCQLYTNETIDLNSYDKKKPLIIPLNTNDGYRFNILTGDSIIPSTNSLGVSVSTGKPIFYKIDPIPFQKFYKTSILKNQKEEKSKIENFKFQSTRIEFKDSLKTLIFFKNNEYLESESTSHKSTLGTEVILHGIIKKYHEPYPSKSLPMRFKEDVSSNIQFLDVEQGLGFSYINTLIVDKKGNLWFGTEGFGLSKYNGVNFINYTVKDGLVSNAITEILEDHFGNIWIGTQNGISLFDGDKFIQFTEKEGLNNNYILSFFEDSKGNIWVGTKGGVNKIEYNNQNIVTSKCTHYTVKDGLPNNEVSSILEDKNGQIWFGTINGLAYFDTKKIRDIPIKSSLNLHTFICLKDKSGNLWFGTNEGLIQFDGEKFIKLSTPIGKPIKFISSLIEDKGGNIWIGTRLNGLIKYDGKIFEYYEQRLGLINSKINKVVEDSQKNIWCSVDGGGIIKINNVGFDYLIDKSYFNFSRVRPIKKDTLGNLWFGTENGHIYEYNNAHFYKYSFFDSANLTYGIRSILVDHSGKLWFGRTDGGGILKYDNKQFIELLDKKTNLPLNNMSLELLSDGSIGIGTYGNGTNIIKGNTDKLEKTNVLRFSEKEGLVSNKILKVFNDNNNNLWFGTEGGGLCKFDGTNLTNYTEREGLFAKSITSIEEDNEHNIWLGSSGSGVCKFDGKSFTYITEQQGLSNNNVWSIVKDTAGQLWVGTDKGLSMIQINQRNTSGSDYTIFNYATQSGLKATDFNLHSVCIDNNKRIWWGTGKGVPSLDLRKGFNTSQPYSLSVNQIEINEKYYDFRNLTDDIKNNVSYSSTYLCKNLPKDLTLSFDQNHLTFHFSCIDWSAPEKIKYSYRLMGLDTKWSNANEATSADFRNLNHGKYQFEIKAKGESQIWTAPVYYSFVIRPAWWQTWWFKIVYSLVIIGIVFVIVRFIYLSNLHKQKAELEKQLAVQIERQRISSEMHDDIGAGLSGVRLLTEFTKSKSKAGDITDELDKIYQSVGDISAKMREVIWSLNIDNDSLPSLIHYIQKQARIILEHYPGELVITIPDIIPDVKIIGQKRRNIYLSVKEALHNIIKHSGADKIEIAILCGEEIQIKISDNGKGLELSEQTYTGNGIRNIQKRTQQMNAKVTFENKDGFTLIFEIPYN